MDSLHAYRTAPAQAAVAVTPHDTNALPNGRCRALYVGTAGNLTVVCSQGDTAVLFTTVPGGSILPVEVYQVKSTGTTASNLVALY